MEYRRIGGIDTSRPKIPIIERKKMHKIGGSIMLPIPLDWFRAHGLGETPEEIQMNLEKAELDFLVLGDRDIRIVNPNHREEVEEEVYHDISKKVSKANITEDIK